MYLFSLASRQASWLSVRQSAIAENVANANTPGHVSKDVEPFRDILESTSLKMAATQSGHLSEMGAAAKKADLRKEDSWQVTYSDNTVSLEQEMIKSGEVLRQHNLNTAISRSFHGFMLASLGK